MTGEWADSATHISAEDPIPLPGSVLSRRDAVRYSLNHNDPVLIS